MRKYLLFIAVLGLGVVAGVGPTFATEKGSAVETCKKNKNCIMTPTADGGMSLWVNHPGGGTNEVYCPNSGECVCLDCGGDGSGRPARVGRDIGYIIRPQMNAPQSLSEQGPSGPAAAPAPQYPTDGPALP